jgi:hypothetical protein
MTAELLAAIEQTMQPTQASLWLRAQGTPGAVGGPVTRQLDG